MQETLQRWLQDKNVQMAIVLLVALILIAVVPAFADYRDQLDAVLGIVVAVIFNLVTLMFGAKDAIAFLGGEVRERGESATHALTSRKAINSIIGVIVLFIIGAIPELGGNEESVTTLIYALFSMPAVYALSDVGETAARTYARRKDVTPASA